MFYITEDDVMLKHFSPWDHYYIETPERLKAVQNRLEETGLVGRMQRLEPRRATEQEILAVHSAEYVAALREAMKKPDSLESFCSTMEDIFANEDTLDAALLSAGCAIEATRAAYENKGVSFAAIRPPGHHALHGAACGFCFFNNVVVSAKQARSCGARRILIVDWDVHAGQGTQECIQGDEDILLMSIHRYEHGTFWPNLEQSAVENKFNNTINVPLNGVGLGDVDFLAIFHLLVLPLARSFKPDLILVSCGFDSTIGDPEGEMKVSPAGYARMTRLLMRIGAPLALLLEGGYFLPSLAASAEFTVRALLDEQLHDIHDSKDINPELLATLRHALRRAAAMGRFPIIQSIADLIGPCPTLPPCGEYRGEREVPDSWPTRGVYTQRPAAVEKTLEAEFAAVLDGYKTQEKRKEKQIALKSGAFAVNGTVDSMELTTPMQFHALLEEAVIKFVSPNYVAARSENELLVDGDENFDELHSFLFELKNNELFRDVPLLKLI